MTKRQPDDAAAFVLDPSDASSLLLRFSAGVDGSIVPVVGDAYPPPRDCVGRLLAKQEAQRALKERRRMTGNDGAHNETAARENEVQQLRGLQRSAVANLQQVAEVCELLRRTAWGVAGQEKIRFLQLVPTTLAPRKGVPTSEETDFKSWSQRLSSDVVSDLLPQRHSDDMQTVLAFLRRRWLLHSVSGRLIVELLTPKLEADARPNKADAQRTGRFVAFLDEEPKLGVCLTFPLDAARLVERRQRLFVEILPVCNRDANKAKRTRAQPVVEAGDATRSRAEQIHAVLLDAQETLLDHEIFAALCRGSPEAVGARGGWQMMRSSLMLGGPLEVVLALPALPDPILFRVQYAARIGIGTTPSEDVNGKDIDVMWSWLGSFALPVLREMFVKEKIDSSSFSHVDFATHVMDWLEEQACALVECAHSMSV